MADGAHIFNFGIPYIPGKANARDFKFGAALAMRSNFENMQKVGQRGREPVYAIYYIVYLSNC